MTINDFINKLDRPLMVYRFARANLRNPRQARSAATRMRNAEREITELVREFADSMFADSLNIEEIE